MMWGGGWCDNGLHIRLSHEYLNAKSLSKACRSMQVHDCTLAMRRGNQAEMNEKRNSAKGKVQDKGVGVRLKQPAFYRFPLCLIGLRRIRKCTRDYGCVQQNIAMSFGLSLSDFAQAAELGWKIHRTCFTKAESAGELTISISHRVLMLAWCIAGTCYLLRGCCLFIRVDLIPLPHRYQVRSIW